MPRSRLASILSHNGTLSHKRFIAVLISINLIIYGYITFFYEAKDKEMFKIIVTALEGVDIVCITGATAEWFSKKKSEEKITE